MAANILVTEDEAIVRKDIERCLTSLGYNVVATADNGEDAIKSALEHKAGLVSNGHHDKRRHERNRCR